MKGVTFDQAAGVLILTWVLSAAVAFRVLLATERAFRRDVWFATRLTSRVARGRGRLIALAYLHERGKP